MQSAGNDLKISLFHGKVMFHFWHITFVFGHHLNMKLGQLICHGK